ncbi:MAG: phytoene/squalene synthase family protein [Hyphomonas sp.]
MPADSDDLPISEDIAECTRLIREGSKSFHAASLILPSDVRQAARALYAFCRVADDRIDEGRDPSAALEGLRRRLSNAYARRPDDNAVDRMFAWVIARYAIPRAIPEALLEGFAWDAEGRFYRSFEDLKAYAVRVAGTVGVMMALVMGERRPEALGRAIDLGIAMQLTNIARDVGEDARAGRCYLPEDWLAEAGISREALIAAPYPDARVRALVQRLLEAAEPFYASGLAGTGYLRSDCRAAIRAAGLIYKDIGREIEANAWDSVSRRAAVSSHRKLYLAARAVSLKPHATGRQVTEPAGQFLIRAVNLRAIPGRPGAAPLAGWPWVMDLFLKMERRQENGSIME